MKCCPCSCNLWTLKHSIARGTRSLLTPAAKALENESKTLHGCEIYMQTMNEMLYFTEGKVPGKLKQFLMITSNCVTLCEGV